MCLQSSGCRPAQQLQPRCAVGVHPSWMHTGARGQRSQLPRLPGHSTGLAQAALRLECRRSRRSSRVPACRRRCRRQAGCHTSSRCHQSSSGECLRRCPLQAGPCSSSHQQGRRVGGCPRRCRLPAGSRPRSLLLCKEQLRPFSSKRGSRGKARGSAFLALLAGPAQTSHLQRQAAAAPRRGSQQPSERGEVQHQRPAPVALHRQSPLAMQWLRRRRSRACRAHCGRRAPWRCPTWRLLRPSMPRLCRRCSRQLGGRSLLMQAT